MQAWRQCLSSAYESDFSWALDPRGWYHFPLFILQRFLGYGELSSSPYGGLMTAYFPRLVGNGIKWVWKNALTKNTLNTWKGAYHDFWPPIASLLNLAMSSAYKEFEARSQIQLSRLGIAPDIQKTATSWKMISVRRNKGNKTINES